MNVELSKGVRIVESTQLMIVIDLRSNRYYKVRDGSLEVLRKVIMNKGKCSVGKRDLKSARELLRLGVIHQL